MNKIMLLLQANSEVIHLSPGRYTSLYAICICSVIVLVCVRQDLKLLNLTLYPTLEWCHHRSGGVIWSCNYCIYGFWLLSFVSMTILATTLAATATTVTISHIPSLQRLCLDIFWHFHGDAFALSDHQTIVIASLWYCQKYAKNTYKKTGCIYRQRPNSLRLNVKVVVFKGI